MNSRIKPAPIGGSALVRDYLSEVPAALDFFVGSPRTLATYKAKLADVTGRFPRERREDAARALFAPSPLARERLERFVVEGGAVVTTGQQAGFLTGPLYTIYKALSAVVLARHLEERLGCIVLPVFWAATEDHDWAEVNHAYLLDPRGRIRRFDLPGGAVEGSHPMSHHGLGPNIEQLCADAMQYVGGQRDAAEYLDRILAPYRDSGATVGGAFVGTVSELLSQFGVLIADAANHALKRASLPALTAALTEAEAHETALFERSRELLDAGYGTQVTILERGVNLFLHGENGRERLYRRGDAFMVRERQGVLERDELTGLLEREPERFSPNVLLRPVVESTVFPTLAYVGGPGEINYFAQATALFRAMGMMPPAVVPRFSATVVEPALHRVMGSLQLSETDLTEPREILRERLARREMPEDVKEILRSIRGGWTDGFGHLSEQGEGIDPTLVGAIGAIRNRGLMEATRAERKFIRALKRADSVWQQQLDRVLDSLRPMGQPQDRVVNVLTYLGRSGPEFLLEAERSIRENWSLPEGA